MTRWRVYILQCADGTYYAGSTTDLKRRLAEHQAGRGCRYTRPRRPVRVVWSQGCRDRRAAQSREARIKAMSRADKTACIRARRRLRIPYTSHQVARRIEVPLAPTPLPHREKGKRIPRSKPRGSGSSV